MARATVARDATAATAAPAGALKLWPYWHPVVIVTVATLFRAIYHIAYKPWWTADSQGYTDTYRLWVHGYFSNGNRQPLYPLLLGLAQWITRSPAQIVISSRAAYMVTFLQSALGIVSALLLYYALRSLPIRPPLALCSALAFSLIGNICLFEMMILSQSLSLFSIVLTSSLFVMTFARVSAGGRFLRFAVATGMGGAFSVLVRPENLVFFAVLVVAAFLVYLRLRRSNTTQAVSFAKLALLLLLSFSPLVLAWMAVNYVATGEFTITTLSVWVSTESVYNLFGGVDPEDRVLGQILQRSYLANNGEGRIYRHHFWLALEEIGAHTSEMPLDWSTNAVSRTGRHKWMHGLSSEKARAYNDPVFFVTGHYVAKVTWKLRRKYPAAYLQNAAENFVEDTFKFRCDLASTAETVDPRAVEGGSVIRLPALWKVIAWINAVQWPLLALAYMTTLGYVVFAPIILSSRNDQDFIANATVSALAAGTLATFSAACLLAAYYPQHGEPFLGVFVICVCFALHNRQRILGALRPGA